MTTQTEIVPIECFKCESCGNVTQTVKRICAKCGGSRITKTQSDGKGEVLDFTIVYYPPDNYKDLCPYTSIMVRLDNGCKLFGVMAGEVKEVSAGSRVTLVKNDVAKGRLVFKLS